jgi:anti-sigma-K factor RskA
MSDRDAAAGEYALSLLTPEEQEAMDRRIALDPALAAAVAEWRGRLLEIDATAAPLAPSPDLWSRIEGGLEQPAPRVEAGEMKPSLLSRLWGDLATLRGAALTGAAASAAVAVWLGVAIEAGRQRPQVIAVLLRADNQPGAIVEVFADGSAYVAPIADVEAAADRVMQVWTLPDPATGPVSLGLLEGETGARLQHANLPPPKPKQLYEITLEPTGGSPTGKPTGPILFKGFAERPR